MKISRPLARAFMAPAAWTLALFLAPLPAWTLALLLGPLPASVTAHENHHHGAAAQQDAAVRRVARYTVPDVTLLDADGLPVRLRGELAGEARPVLLNFVFTTCTAVCPVMSATFAQVQEGLGAERDAVRMLSVSIDPEQDTPAALKAYARRFGAGRQWQMLTGSRDDSIAVQRAFDVYRGDKMNHQPVTFLRAAPGQPWVRLDGFAGAADILREYRQLRAQ